MQCRSGRQCWRWSSPAALLRWAAAAGGLMPLHTRAGTSKTGPMLPGRDSGGCRSLCRSLRPVVQGRRLGLRAGEAHCSRPAGDAGLLLAHAVWRRCGRQHSAPAPLFMTSSVPASASISSPWSAAAGAMAQAATQAAGASAKWTCRTKSACCIADKLRWLQFKCKDLRPPPPPRRHCRRHRHPRRLPRPLGGLMARGEQPAAAKS